MEGSVELFAHQQLKELSQIIDDDWNYVKILLLCRLLEIY
jgi:hypothetical protein